MNEHFNSGENEYVRPITNDSTLSELNNSQLRNLNHSVTQDKEFHIKQVLEDISDKWQPTDGNKNKLCEM